MKYVLSILALAFSLGLGSAAHADVANAQLLDLTAPDCGGSLVGDCDDDEDDVNYRVCAANDANGRQFRYYTTVHHPQTYTQRRAVEKCHAQSASPRSCRAAGCREY